MAVGKDLEKAKKDRSYQIRTINKVLKKIRPYRFTLALSLIFAVITVILTLYFPLLTGEAVDCIIGEGMVDFAAIAPIAVKMAVIAALTALSQWAMNICNNRITYNVTRDIRDEAFKKIEILPLKYIDNHSAGDIVSRVIADVESVRRWSAYGLHTAFYRCSDHTWHIVFYVQDQHCHKFSCASCYTNIPICRRLHRRKNIPIVPPAIRNKGRGNGVYRRNDR